MAVQCVTLNAVFYTGNGGPGFSGNGYKASDTPTPYKSYSITLASLQLHGTLMAAWYQVEQGFSRLSAFDTIIVDRDPGQPNDALVIDLSASAPLQNAWIDANIYFLYSDT
jgi:hypothetical protein